MRDVLRYFPYKYHSSIGYVYFLEFSPMCIFLMGPHPQPHHPSLKMQPRKRRNTASCIYSIRRAFPIIGLLALCLYWPPYPLHAATLPLFLNLISSSEIRMISHFFLMLISSSKIISQFPQINI